MVCLLEYYLCYHDADDSGSLQMPKDYLVRLGKMGYFVDPSWFMVNIGRENEYIVLTVLKDCNASYPSDVIPKYLS